ncbi:MAG: methylated-DNA--[protein]-cysteine S-methyltransferase [Deltaproteobacteria bacterium]|jgi:methylated-DNA-[protein]-cysteine S-methyltransferase|nr:methylated-DNA--[protein]-cysteine S-methyltransferase [Deltaproteobacteria bacterium]
MIYVCTVKTPLGPATVSAEGDALGGFWFVGQKHYPENTADWTEAADYPVFVKLRAWLDDYFAGRVRQPDFPLSPQGTDFQRKVWAFLLEIPAGQTSTYGALAAKMAAQSGRASSARAVGSAVGRNPISLLIPCHRVVGANGSLTGYAGGLDKKIALLRLERGDVPCQVGR